MNTNKKTKNIKQNKAINSFESALENANNLEPLSNIGNNVADERNKGKDKTTIE